ncbi:RapGH repressor [Chlamydia abortus]|uniref:Helix-turn-helix domain-containing protein n=1 Tax=Paenibacillus residui TaxID=629724 RepID=A0ABW3D4V2_9BACL|nr:MULTISPECIES: helix-turn-helix domain-containing protein [Paenibacillaceae]SHE12501.1 RapGH repressor [Chlamydia abortus]
MSVDSRELPLGSLLKDLLRERSLSMRKLSERTGIHTATISRIINGKQQAKPDHLRKLSDHLQVPAEQLFRAAGYAVGEPLEENPSQIDEIVSIIYEVLASSQWFHEHFTVERIEQELNKYEQYARTKEGQQVIHSDFRAKLDQVSGAGPFINQLSDMYRIYEEGQASPEERAVLGSGLLYFILSTDIIPDYIFPFGYLDDAIAVHLVQRRLKEITESRLRSEG